MTNDYEPFADLTDEQPFVHDTMATRPTRPKTNGLTEHKGISGSLSRFWSRTYAPDYIGLFLLLSAYIMIQFFLEPFHRMFTLDNVNIQFPHADPERVPVPWMFLYAGIIPLVTLIIGVVVSRSTAHKTHVTFLGFFIGLVLTLFVTDVIKNAVGRPRPDLISRCKPNPSTDKHKLVDFSVCTETDHHMLHDGWRSFPSGHSSFAFSGLGFLALWLCGQLHVFRPRADLSKGLLALSPLLGAAMIAISRCEDYRHDVYDVTIGSVLGMSITYFSYRRYFRALRHPKCHEPFASRAATQDKFGKVKSDEESLRNVRDFELEDFDSEDERSD